MTHSKYSADYSVVTSLARAAQDHGASESELACISRLQDGSATLTDVERLRPLAALADLPWCDLFPEMDDQCMGWIDA